MAERLKLLTARLPRLTPKKGALISALALSFLLIFVAFYLTYLYLGEATEIPQRVKITNTTDSAATITWVSEKPTLGLVFYSEERWRLLLPFFHRFLAQIASDEILSPTTLHRVTLGNLKNDRPYFYRVSTGLHTYRDFQTENGKRAVLLNLKTGPALPAPPSPRTAYGKVLEINNLTPARNILVYAVLESAQGTRSTLLSTRTNKNGNYSFDLGSGRTPDLSTVFPVKNDDRLRVIFEGGDLGYLEEAFSLKKVQPAPLVHLNPR